MEIVFPSDLKLFQNAALICTIIKRKKCVHNLPSLFMPIVMHFLSRHAWHWLRWALSTTQRPVPAWHLRIKKRANSKELELKQSKSWRGSSAEHIKGINEIRFKRELMRSVWVEISFQTTKLDFASNSKPGIVTYVATFAADVFTARREKSAQKYRSDRNPVD